MSEKTFSSQPWHGMYVARDVTKFTFELTTFEIRTFSVDSKFDECFNRFVVKYEFVEQSLFYTTYLICTERQRVQTNLFFPQIQPITQTTLCLKKTSPTFLAITRKSIDGFFITFGRNVTEKESNHMLLHFPTSPN